MKKTKVKFFAADVAECSLFAVLMIAGAFIKIPFPFMPLTFQTVFAVLAGLMLGWRKGIVSMTAYAFLGLVGLPVFSGGGGIFYVTMPSFGYILGFIAAAGVAGLVEVKKLWQGIALALAAFITDYVFGIAYFIAVWELSGYAGLWHAVLIYNVVYLPKDAILCVLAAILSYTLSPVIRGLRRRKDNKPQLNTETEYLNKEQK